MGTKPCKDRQLAASSFTPTLACKVDLSRGTRVGLLVLYTWATRETPKSRVLFEANFAILEKRDQGSNVHIFKKNGPFCILLGRFGGNFSNSFNPQTPPPPQKKKNCLGAGVKSGVKIARNSRVCLFVCFLHGRANLDIIKGRPYVLKTSGHACVQHQHSSNPREICYRSINETKQKKTYFRFRLDSR